MAPIRMYALLMSKEHESKVDNAMLLAGDFSQYCEIFAKNYVACLSFTADQDVLHEDNRDIQVGTYVINDEVQIFQGRTFTDESFWAQVGIPHLCDYFTDDEIHNMVYTDVAEDVLAQLNLLDLING